MSTATFKICCNCYQTASLGKRSCVCSGRGAIFRKPTEAEIARREAEQLAWQNEIRRYNKAEAPQS